MKHCYSYRSYLQEVNDGMKYLVADGFSQAHAYADVICQAVLHPQSHAVTAPSPGKNNILCN